MLERLKSIHYMFWASLIFMLFPILPVVIGELPAWHLLVDILFVVTYLGVLITKNQRLSWLFWGIMLVYVAGNTAMDISPCSSPCCGATFDFSENRS
ncbi:histidine kinase [Streptococcus pneumoniae]|nr:histidine kinase [Streptococcus pneumoniae]